MQGDFGGNSAVRKVGKSKNPRLMSKMAKSKEIISDMEDASRNSLLRVADAISGCVGNKNDFGDLEEIGKLFHLEGDFGYLQKECGNSENLKNVADFDKAEGVIQLRKGKKRQEESARQNKEVGERNRKMGVRRDDH